jgi:hypothetical protein
MEGVVIYGTGSPIVVEVEESLDRAGLSVCAAIRNMDCESWVLDRSKLLALDSVTEQIKARPFLIPLFTPGNRQSAAREAAGRGFDPPFTLIDPTVPKSKSFQAAPGNVGSLVRMRRHNSGTGQPRARRKRKGLNGSDRTDSLAFLR